MISECVIRVVLQCYFLNQCQETMTQLEKMCAKRDGEPSMRRVRSSSNAEVKLEIEPEPSPMVASLVDDFPVTIDNATSDVRRKSL